MSDIKDLDAAIMKQSIWKNHTEGSIHFFLFAVAFLFVLRNSRRKIYHQRLGACGIYELYAVESINLWASVERGEGK